MPFMPEMLRFCGKTFEISRRAAQICMEGRKIRSLSSSVFLEDLRYDGSAHNGCCRCCSLFWKYAWLKPVSNQRSDSREEVDSSVFLDLSARQVNGRCLCQSTELYAATRPLSRWNPRRWYLGLVGRGLSPGELIRYSIYPFLWKAMSRLARRDVGQIVGKQSKTPEKILNLQPGERVQVKNRSEIAATLNKKGKNRGLTFTPEMNPFCGKHTR
jgi:hypothetical protein